jgi:hypothetical protein
VQGGDDVLKFLFYVQGFQRASSVFEIASRLAEKGEAVVFMFTKKGIRHLVDRGLMRSLSYAESINCLESEVSDMDIKGDVVMLDYPGFVKLIEECPQIVSWA